MASTTFLTVHEKAELDDSLLSAHRSRNMKQVEDIIEQCTDKSYALHNSVFMAATFGNMEYLNETLSTNEIDLSWTTPWGFGRTALHWAAEMGHKDVTELLISKGAMKDATDDYGNSILHCAAQSRNKETFQFVRSTGMDIMAVNNDGDTIMHAAASSGEDGVLKLLCEEGQTITVVNNNGQTPLHKAAAPNRHPYSTDALMYLIKNGADLSAVDKDGNTPLDLAEKGFGCKEHSRILKDALLQGFNN